MTIRITIDNPDFTIGVARKLFPGVGPADGSAPPKRYSHAVVKEHNTQGHPDYVEGCAICEDKAETAALMEASK